MGREAGDYHDQQDPFDLIGVVCPECGEYWEEPGAGWTQCPMCDHEFEVDDETVISTADDDDFISPEPGPLESREFAPLIDTASPLIYRNNGFRVTGLPVDASDRKVKDFEKLAKVGRATDLQRGLLPLAPDQDAVQSAIERLKNGDLRLVDEFFWFWPPEWNQPIDDDLLAALSRADIDGAANILMRQESRNQRGKVVTHNLAVLFHAAALDWEFAAQSGRLSDEELKKWDLYWTQAFRYWQALIDDEGFWKHFSSRIAQLEDPRFTAGQIRGSLPLALALIVAKLALPQAEEGNLTQAKVYLHLILNSGLDRQKVSEALLRVARPMYDRIKAFCDDAENKAELDHLKADASVGNLLTQAGPLLTVMECFLNPTMENLLVKEGAADTQLLINARDDVAKTVHLALVSFGNETEKWEVCAQYLEKALPIAVSLDLRDEIRKALDTVRGNARYQQITSCLDDLFEEVDGLLKSSLSPEAKFRNLSAISRGRLAVIKQKLGEATDGYATACDILASGIRSVAIDLHNKARQFQLALEAVNLALSLCRDPDLRQQLINDRSGITKNAEMERVVGNLKPISSAPGLFSMNGIGTTLYGRSDYDKNTNSYLTTLYFIILAIPIFPIARYRVIDLGPNSYQFLGKVPIRRGDVIHRLMALGFAIWVFIAVCSNTSTTPSTRAIPTPTATVSDQYSIPQLIEYLNSPAASARIWASKKLAERGAEARQAIPALRLKLKDKDKEVRAAAKAALAKISPTVGISEYAPQPADGNGAGQSASSTTPTDSEVFIVKQPNYEIQQLGKEIDSANEQIHQLEADMESLEAQLKSLKEQIDDYATSLRSYKRDIDLGYAVDTDSYNNAVTRHNSLVREHNQLLGQYRPIAARYNALVSETKEKVNRYNNLIRGQR